MQAPSNKPIRPQSQTHTCRHISDIDVYFSILITHHACVVGSTGWMSMSMCETSCHLQNLQGHYLNQHYPSVRVYPSKLFFKEDLWCSLTVYFCHSNQAPLDQWWKPNSPFIYSGVKRESVQETGIFWGWHGPLLGLKVVLGFFIKIKA